MQHHIVEVTPTLDTSAFSSGDHLGSLMTLTGVCPAGAAGAVLRAVTVVDKAKQSAAMTVLLFDAQPTVSSTENNALDISDAEMGDKCLGAVAIATGDYAALNANSVATKQCELPVKPAASATLYAQLMCGGSPTYAASSLVFRFHFTWE